MEYIEYHGHKPSENSKSGLYLNACSIDPQVLVIACGGEGFTVLASPDQNYSGHPYSGTLIIYNCALM